MARITSLFQVVALLLAVSLVAAVRPTRVSETKYEVKFHERSIKMWDNKTILHCDAFVPVPKTANETFPLLIFANSWGMPQIEYIAKNLAWAETGYVALEYETRGWYLSGGEIGTAGPLDRQDGVSVIDWALSLSEEWNINIDKIAFVGISYGAGIAIEMAGYDPRVTTSVSMSGWANLTNAFYGDATPNKVWADLLVILAKLVGHPNEQLSEIYNDLVSHKNMSAVVEFAKIRGGEMFLDEINRRKVPLFVSNNFADMIFHPRFVSEFYEKLQGPKFFMMNHGGHAEAELTGIIPIAKNEIYINAKKWLDHYLKGAENGITTGNKLRMQVDYLGNDFLSFPNWPLTNATTSFVKLDFVNRGAAKWGGLRAASEVAAKATPDAIGFEEVTGMNQGIPLISNYLTPLIPVTADLNAVSRKGAIVYMSEKFPTATVICGEPQYTVSFVPNSPQWQLYGYLYSVGDDGWGALRSTSFFSHWKDGPNSNKAKVVDGKASINANFHVQCFTLPQGHRIAVGFNLFNAEYQFANRDLEVNFLYEEGNGVTLPVYKPQ